MDKLNDVVKEFLVESHEGLEQFERDLVVLEENGSDSDRLSAVFRAIHTIKGTSGFFGFQKLGAIAHAGENLLSRLRDGELKFCTEIASALLAMVDALRGLLATIEERGVESENDHAELIEQLNALASSDTPAKPQAPATAQVSSAGGDAPKMQALLASIGWEEADEKPATKIGAILVENHVVGPEEVMMALDRQRQGDSRPVGDILIEQSAATPSAVNQAAEIQKSRLDTGSVSESTIRVDVGLLDKLMNQVGELVLVRNQILQFTNAREDAALNAASQRLNLITSELQEGVMKTRMQPIGNIWNKLPRVVRDLALACGKQVGLKMEGKDTELDKTLIEAIKDPLTHIVRNSVDHGIELPEVRRASGKPAEGSIQMRAYHEGGQVNIEIKDDGAGIDPERVKQKAIERGLVTRDQVSRLSERDTLNLVFLPGFSTAEKVTSVSGRGVGMDVVKTNIERIGGTVELHSKAGNGATLKIKIPLTLAIIPALVITSGGDRYAIPQVSLLELVRLEGEEVRRKVETIHGAAVYRLRAKLLPLVYLNRELKVDGESTVAASDLINIVVLQADDRQFGLVVDTINDTEEIVVKPLSKQLKGIPTYAGATIMGDGRVALILDVLGLAQRAHVVAEVRERALVDENLQSAKADEERKTLLLFRGQDNSRMAIPLSVVSRLEEFPPTALERSGGQNVVQYRGRILPLVHASHLFQERRKQARHPAIKQVSDTTHVVVCTQDGFSVGLVVEKILDIVESDLSVRRETNRPGVLFSVVIGDHVTELLDASAVIRAAEPDRASTPRPVRTVAGA